MLNLFHRLERDFIVRQSFVMTFASKKTSRVAIGCSSLALALGLVGCSDSTSDPAASNSSPTASESAQTAEESAPEAAQTVEEATETQEATSEPIPVPEPVVDETACLDIEFNFKKDWEDKGKSYQQLWLMSNATMTNNCDTTVKSVKYVFFMVDDFGEPWPQSYNNQEKIDLEPGETAIQDSTVGYPHYDSDANYQLLQDTPAKALEGYIENITLALEGGVKLSGTRNEMPSE